MFIFKCRFRFLRSPNGQLNVRLNAAKTGSWGNCIIYIFNMTFELNLFESILFFSKLLNLFISFLFQYFLSNREIFSKSL